MRKSYRARRSTTAILGAVRKLAALSALLVLQGCAARARVAAAPAPVHEPTPAEPAPAAEPEAVAAVDDEEDEVEGEPGEEGTEDSSTGTPRTHPKIDLSDEQIADRAKRDLASLGSLSLGQPAHGSLVNGIQMPRDPRWKLMDPGNAWGTKETVDFIALAIGRVNEKFPETPPLPLGDISARNGGHLTPHRSHQAGRDVDINYYLRGDQKWYSHTNAQNIDLPRCWALVKTFINETDVDMIFIDTSIQRLLADYAVSAGEDPAWVDSLFQVRGKNWAAKIRHVRGHATHLHVRFFSPMAQEMGRRAERYLPASARPVAVAAKSAAPAKGAHASNDTHGRRGDKGDKVRADKTDRAHESDKGEKGGNVAASTHYVMHRARSGDVLVNLAKHYNTTPEAIQQANGMKGNALQIGHTYKIPVNSQSSGPHPARHSGT